MSACPEKCAWCSVTSQSELERLLKEYKQVTWPVSGIIEKDKNITLVTGVEITDRHGEAECRVSGEKEGVGEIRVMTKYFKFN